MEFDIDGWLAAHSTCVDRVGREILFTHFTGETSVLIPREAAIGARIAVESGYLKCFYEKFAGASIGNSQLFIATDVLGGLEISHGFVLPGLNSMGRTIREFEVKLPAQERPFMVEAGWQFIYTIEGNAEEIIRLHDRDFGNSEVVPDVREVFEQWWQLLQEDPNAG